MSDPPPLEVLLPAERAGTVLAPEPAETELAAVLAHPSGDRGQPFVRANMVAGVDGGTWDGAGRTGGLGTPADLRVLVLLRSLADAVLVGAGTIRAEGYGPLRTRPAFAARRRAADQDSAPRLAVVTRTCDVPADRGLLDAGAATLVVTCEAAGSDAVTRVRSRLGADAVLVAGDDDVDLGAALDALAALGLGRVLTEGGPRLLAALVAAGRLDELCLTTAPALLGGDAARVLDGPAVGGTSGVPVRLLSLLHHEGTLLARWSTR